MKIQSSNEMKRYNYLCGEIEAVYHEMSWKLGLSDSAMTVLYCICIGGDSCLLQEIYGQSGVSKQTINSAIRKLEAEGILYLESVNAKNKRVCLTEKGRRLAQSTAIKIIDIENHIFASWQEEDVEKYLELTERYLSALQEETKKMKGDFK